MYIFLDIDGVLIKEDFPGEEIDLDEELMKFDEECLNIFESVICKYEHSRIIISSSWREVFGLETITSLFSTEVAAKILGATPRLRFPVKYFRHKEVLDYLKQHGLEEQPWIAIDDIAEHYPPDAPIIVTNPYEGFDQKSADKLEIFLSTSLAKKSFSLKNLSRKKFFQQTVMKITILSLKEVQIYQPADSACLIRIFGNEESYQEYSHVEGSFVKSAVYFFDDFDLYLEAQSGTEHLKKIIHTENPQIFHKNLAVNIISEFDTWKRHESFEELVVHCYLGAGRSPAIALALNEIFQLGCRTQDLIKLYSEYNEYIFDVMVAVGKNYLLSE
jgi:hypothetical protein